MKIIAIVFVSVIGLVGFTTNGFSQNAGVGAKQPPGQGKTVDLKVTQLPEAARNALDAVGVTDIAAMIAFDKSGQPHMLKAEEVEHRKNVTFPIATTEIQGIASISMARYTGPANETAISLVGFETNGLAQAMEVKDLPEAAIKALEEEGMDIAAVVCVDKTGEMHMMKDKDINARDTTFPIETTAIEEITSMSMVRHKGSTCVTIIINGASVTICW